MSFINNIFGNKKNKLLTEEEFSTAYFEVFNKKLPEAKLLAYDSLELEINLGNEEENTVTQFLDNAFSEYNNTPENIEAIFDNYSTALLSFLEEQNEDISIKNIVPVIKNVEFLESNIELNPDFKKDFLFERINDELYIFYALNNANTLQFLQKKDFETLEIPKESLKELAIENLKNISGEIQRQGDNGYYSILLDGTFEASVLLFDIWNKENFNIKGDIVIAVPSRDVLLITGSEDSENLINMKDTTIEICQTGDHIISEKLFILKDGKIEVFA